MTVEPVTPALLPEGFRIGHWTDRSARTGCTVILCPPGTVGGCDIRGSSPGTREVALLASERSMNEVHAVLLTGGSAFGLAAADGVMGYLEEQGIGYGTPWAVVPIVPAAVIYDLNVAGGGVRPSAAQGHAACRAATAGPAETGSVGAGTGATVGKWAGMEGWMWGGTGSAALRAGDILVSSLVVVNAMGDVVDDRGEVIAGARLPDGGWRGSADPLRLFSMRKPSEPDGTNTTLAAVMTNARLTKVFANRVAARAHDGMARAIRPVHTSYDGDTVFVLASGGIEAPLDLVAELAAETVASAIRTAVGRDESVPPAAPQRSST